MRALAVILMAVAVLAGCGGRSGEIFDTESPRRFKDDERKAIQREIDQLAKGKDTADIEGTAAYSDAVNKLTGRGAKIEPQLIEALVGNADWAVRMGVLEVLASVGTRACVDSVIGATKDAQPLVALHANKLLEAMLGHRVIPAAGQPVADGLPPVPPRDPVVLDLDAEERIWSSWHREHGAALHQQWLAWWKANRGTAKIQ